MSLCSKKHVIARSCTKYEYRSMAHLCTKITWITSLLSKLKLKSSLVPLIWTNKKSASIMVAKPIYHARTKHIEIDLYFQLEKLRLYMCPVKNKQLTSLPKSCLQKNLRSSEISLRCLTTSELEWGYWKEFAFGHCATIFENRRDMVKLNFIIAFCWKNVKKFYGHKCCCFS